MSGQLLKKKSVPSFPAYSVETMLLETFFGQIRK